MAMELLSPRISFSHDLIQSDGNSCNGIPVDRYRSDSSLLDSSPDFNFCISLRSDQESSSADELFSDGKILPLQFKRPLVVVANPRTEQPKSPPMVLQNRKKESLREIMAEEKPDPIEKTEKPTSSKSFWRFRRSSSLNSGNGQKSSSIWSLQLLSRSNSTGSTDQSPKQSNSKDTHKTFLQKSMSNSNSKWFPPSPSSSPSSSMQKPPLRKNSSFGKTHYGSYGNGVRISPVLNVPPPYISKGTMNLFGFGYLFCNRKDKKMKKKPFPPNAP